MYATLIRGLPVSTISNYPWLFQSKVPVAKGPRLWQLAYFTILAEPRPAYNPYFATIISQSKELMALVLYSSKCPKGLTNKSRLPTILKKHFFRMVLKNNFNKKIIKMSWKWQPYNRSEPYLNPSFAMWIVVSLGLSLSWPESTPLPHLVFSQLACGEQLPFSAWASLFL